MKGSSLSCFLPRETQEHRFSHFSVAEWILFVCAPVSAGPEVRVLGKKSLRGLILTDPQLIVQEQCLSSQLALPQTSVFTELLPPAPRALAPPPPGAQAEQGAFWVGCGKILEGGACVKGSSGMQMSRKCCGPAGEGAENGGNSAAFVRIFEVL